MDNEFVNYKEDAISRVLEEIFQTLKRKRIYGSENIMRFGTEGIVVREFDKLARLENIVWHKKDNTVPEEGVYDTLIDIAGYAIIGILLMRHEWLLPWEADMFVEDEEMKGDIVDEHTKKK